MTLAPIWSLLRTRTAAFAHDLLMIPFAWFGALWLRFNLDSIPAAYLEQALFLLPVLVVVQGGSFLYFGLYRGVWRFASVSDLVRIVQAVVIGVSLCAVAAFLITRLVYIPRASFPLYAGLLMILLSGPRLAYRWFKDRRPRDERTRKALIVGAGRAGEILARALLRDPSSEFVPLGFVDDNPDKNGRTIHDVRVLGHCGQIPEIAERDGADAIIIAIPSATSIQVRRLVELCERANRPVRTVPNMVDIVSGQAQPYELRAITIEDLLDREPVEPDWSAIRNELTGRAILVTGGGGSIGSELCRQIARLDPARLIIVDNGEFNLHRTELDLQEKFPSLAIAVVLADICDTAATARIFDRFHPDVVFHAAAYKQVPILESHVREAVRVNTLGTRTVARAAAQYGTDCFVLVSSDKAVNPVNAMGASKRLAEMVCQSVDEASASTRFIAVRFGNVLDSAGSVVPRFRAQIAAGGPVTVTAREMERYFMTIPEACQLIMASSALGRGGEVFVLDMGSPMRILYLAERMIRLAGKEPGKDIAIEFVGPRPGEKLTEELFHATELSAPTSHEKIFIARGRPVEPAEFEAQIRRLRDASDAFEESALRRVLSELVPEYYCPPASETDHAPSRRASRRLRAPSPPKPAARLVPGRGEKRG